MATIDEYRNEAYELFNETVENDDFNGTNYWQIGCVFDTITDYLEQDAGFNDRKVTAAQVEQLMEKVYLDYQGLVQYNTPTSRNYSWYDDFAWWGIACSKAFWPSFADVFGSQARYYQKISLTTWEIMKNGKYDHVRFGAPNVWEQCDQKTFSDCEPRFAGGVWQYDIFGQQRPLELEDSPTNPNTPINLAPFSAVNLGAYQNTVTNGLYFVLAGRLAAAGYESQGTADTIFGFFDSWFNDASVKGTEYSLNQPVAGGQLIGERVSSYKNRSIVNGWKRGLAWGGDQGLVLGALAEYRRDSDGPAWIDQLLADIMGGVAGSMKGSQGNYNYVMPWYPVDGNKLQTIDPGDYSSGVGVYMRYLNRAYGFDPTVKAALDEDGNPMRQLILDSAASVQAGQLPSWDNQLFGCFNQLAIMVMAISLLQNEGS